MSSLLKIECDGLQVEFDSISMNGPQESSDSLLREVQQKIEDVDSSLESIQKKLDVLNADIERLTNHADGMDYMVSVAGGILTGLIDSVFVGEWNFKSAKAACNRQINEKVMDFAKSKGFNGNRLEDAIAFLEKKFKLPGDGSFMGMGLGITPGSHHIDDICHHPSIVGLICCVLVQLTETSTYVDNDCKAHFIPVHVNEYGRFSGDGFASQVFCGIVNWFLNVAGAIANARGHWMSDIAGSSSAKKGGAGLPGPIMSLLKELSSVPGIGSTEFGNGLRKAFQNGIGTGKSQVDLGIFNALFKDADSKLDFRTEMAVISELKRQSMPVVLNEVVVRAFYFVRHLTQEIKAKNGIDGIDWKNILPLNNRTIVRMLTIAHGTFCAVDLTDAAIHSAAKSCGNEAAFAENMILRVNFVGIGRFAVAAVTDAAMGVKREFKQCERSSLVSKQMLYLNAKILYQQTEMWVHAKEAEMNLRDLEKKVNSKKFDDLEDSIDGLLKD